MDCLTIALTGSASVGKTYLLNNLPNGQSWQSKAFLCNKNQNAFRDDGLKTTTLENTDDSFYVIEHGDGNLIVVTTAGDSADCIKKASEYVRHVCKLHSNAKKVVWIVALSCTDYQYQSLGIGNPKRSVLYEIIKTSKDVLKTSAIHLVPIFGDKRKTNIRDDRHDNDSFASAKKQLIDDIETFLKEQ